MVSIFLSITWNLDSTIRPPFDTIVLSKTKKGFEFYFLLRNIADIPFKNFRHFPFGFERLWLQHSGVSSCWWIWSEQRFKRGSKSGSFEKSFPSSQICGCSKQYWNQLGRNQTKDEQKCNQTVYSTARCKNSNFLGKFVNIKTQTKHYQVRF